MLVGSTDNPSEADFLLADSTDADAFTRAVVKAGSPTTSASVRLESSTGSGTAELWFDPVANAATLKAIPTGSVLRLYGRTNAGLTIDQNGDVTADGVICADNVACVSDARLKQDVQPLGHALDRLLALRGVSFEWRDATRRAEDGPQIGMIAQEVERVFPGWVRERADGVKMVAYNGFEGLTVEAIRELRETGDARLDALARDVERLAASVDALERENARLRAGLGGCSLVLTACA
ncbi:MAG: tail fiber domain-containing protein [Thermoleophilia bacterium]